MNTKNVFYKNRKLQFDYSVIEEVECGMVLSKQQVRLIRKKQFPFLGSFCYVKNDEVFLTITNASLDEESEFKLLINRNQLRDIKKFLGQHKNSTLIPSSVYRSGRYLKLSLAYCCGKKQYDKRQDLIKKQSFDK